MNPPPDRYQSAIQHAINRGILTWSVLLERLRRCQLKEVTTQGVLVVSVCTAENYWWLTHGRWADWLGHISGEHIYFVLEEQR